MYKTVIFDLDDTLTNDYENIKVSNWRECKEILDSVDEVK